MEEQDYTYVNGDGQYRGNILLDPQGTVTRAEMYDAIAEVNRPVNVTLHPEPWALWISLAIALLLGAILCALCAVARQIRLARLTSWTGRIEVNRKGMRRHG